MEKVLLGRHTLSSISRTPWGKKLIPGKNFLHLSVLRLFQESPPTKSLFSARSELQTAGLGHYSCCFLVLLDWPLTEATQSTPSPNLPAQVRRSLLPLPLAIDNGTGTTLLGTKVIFISKVAVGQPLSIQPTFSQQFFPAVFTQTLDWKQQRTKTNFPKGEFRH